MVEIQLPVSLLQELSDTLGISISVLWTVVLAVSSILIMTIAAWITGSIRIGLLASTGIWITGAFIGIIPLWVGLLSGFFTTGYFIWTGGVFNEQHHGMNIAVLIGVMIAIVVGVNLIGPITSSLNNITQNVTENATQTGGGAIGTIAGILPIIFVAVIILGAVAWIGGMPGTDSEEKKERRAKVKAFFKNPREVIIRIEDSSRKWEKYINNLDGLLGIRTVVSPCASGLRLFANNELYIDEKNYDWYIADKLQGQDIFKIVGLHKKDASMNLVFLLGVKGEPRQPFLTEVPFEFLEASCTQCWEWMTAREITRTIKV